MSLTDDARCRIILSDPPLEQNGGRALCESLCKLFAQFVREGRMRAWDIAVEHHGTALVLAWDPPAPLSGCSHDKINAILALHEREGRQLLAPPPICIRVDGGWRLVDRRGLRTHATAGTALLDHRCERLGDWRSAGVTTVGRSWASGLLSPAA